MQEFTVDNGEYKTNYILNGKAFIIVNIYPNITKSKDSFLQVKRALVSKGKKVLVKPDSHRKIEKKGKERYIRVMGYKVKVEE